MDWNSTITSDSNNLPEGEYPYVITYCEKSETSGRGKLPVCPMLIVTAEITTPYGSTLELKDYLVLHESMEWKIGQFLVSIGQKEKGKDCIPDWSSKAIMGKRGYLLTRNEEGRNGGTFARVAKWLDKKASSKNEAEEDTEEFFGDDFEPIKNDRIPF